MIGYDRERDLEETLIVLQCFRAYNRKDRTAWRKADVRALKKKGMGIGNITERAGN